MIPTTIVKIRCYGMSVILPQPTQKSLHPDVPSSDEYIVMSSFTLKLDDLEIRPQG
jgi:hypothetical protein